MLDRIIKVSQHQAYMIYNDGRVIGLYSSNDVNYIINVIMKTEYAVSYEDTQEIIIDQDLMTGIEAA